MHFDPRSKMGEFEKCSVKGNKRDSLLSCYLEAGKCILIVRFTKDGSWGNSIPPSSRS